MEKNRRTSSTKVRTDRPGEHHRLLPDWSLPDLQGHRLTQLTGLEDRPCVLAESFRVERDEVRVLTSLPQPLDATFKPWSDAGIEPRLGITYHVRSDEETFRRKKVRT